MGIVDGLFGTILIAVVVSSILFGILTVQVRTYLTRFPNDPNWMKRFVVFLWVIDAGHQIATCMTIYKYLVSHFLDPTYLAVNAHALGATVTLEPIPALAVQLYFARRLYILNPAWLPIVGLIVVLALVAFGLGMACGIIIHTLHFLVQFHDYTWLVTSWLIICAVCDAIIAISIAYQLWSSRSGFKATDKLLTTLTLWTVNTGMVPAAFAIADAITFVKLPDTLIHLSLNMVLAKLYSNTALGFLNRRRSAKAPRIITGETLGGLRIPATAGSFQMNAFQYTATSGATATTSRGEPNVRFAVTTEQFTEDDEYNIDPQNPNDPVREYFLAVAAA
ncbi:hypothetical protein DL93DRAFT_2087775 [Clavulina sp. PMI_390]|nr:hypothetical protein DL93DRAFT_2087775 [Clavulina sp. PMI_390]